MTSRMWWNTICILIANAANQYHTEAVPYGRGSTDSCSCTTANTESCHFDHEDAHARAIQIHELSELSDPDRHLPELSPPPVPRLQLRPTLPKCVNSMQLPCRIKDKTFVHIDATQSTEGAFSVLFGAYQTSGNGFADKNRTFIVKFAKVW